MTPTSESSCSTSGQASGPVEWWLFILFLFWSDGVNCGLPLPFSRTTSHTHAGLGCLATCSPVSGRSNNKGITKWQGSWHRRTQKGNLINSHSQNQLPKESFTISYCWTFCSSEIACYFICALDSDNHWGTVSIDDGNAL